MLVGVSLIMWAIPAYTWWQLERLGVPQAVPKGEQRRAVHAVQDGVNMVDGSQASLTEQGERYSRYSSDPGGTSMQRWQHARCTGSSMQGARSTRSTGSTAQALTMELAPKGGKDAAPSYGCRQAGGQVLGSEDGAMRELAATGSGCPMPESESESPRSARHAHVDTPSPHRPWAGSGTQAYIVLGQPGSGSGHAAGALAPPAALPRLAASRYRCDSSDAGGRSSSGAAAAGQWQQGRRLAAEGGGDGGGEEDEAGSPFPPACYSSRCATPAAAAAAALRAPAGQQQGASNAAVAGSKRQLWRERCGDLMLLR